jgi:CDGSH-type Zn-finger protein
MPKRPSGTKDRKDAQAAIKITKDGPYLVSGDLPLGKEIIETGKGGIPLRWKKGGDYPKQEGYALCRCGCSTNKPYCTGAHTEAGFCGDETASRKKYSELSEKTSGPGVDLCDAISLCSSARFCDLGDGAWKLTENSKDPKARKEAIRQACACPSGRLVAMDKKTGKAIEPMFKPSVSIVEDPGADSSGPIWVKGGVPIESSDGTTYEIRNRVTLCRCGRSENKPLCDGTHVQIRFNDGDRMLKKK